MTDKNKELVCICGHPASQHEPDTEDSVCLAGMCSCVKFICAAREVDLVNSPPHYNSHPSGVEAITITEAYNFNVGNAIKYLWRAGLKSESPIEDLEKAKWYVTREIERLKKEEPQ